MFDVTNKVVLIFGGLGGIGKCTVFEFLQHRARGIVIADIESVEENEALTNYVKSLTKTFGENRIDYIKCDVAQLAEIKNAFEATLSRFGDVDVVINCAAISNEECYALNITINLIGTMHITNEAYKYILRNKSPASNQGVIVNMSSIVAFNPLLCFPAYSAAKSAIIAFSYSMGKTKELEGDTSIKILTLCPGITETELIHTSRQYLKDAQGAKEEYVKRLFYPSLIQSAKSVAKCVLHIVREGENASCWLSMDDNDAQRIDYDAILAFASDKMGTAPECLLATNISSIPMNNV